MLEKYMVHPCTLYPQAVDEYNNIRLTNGVSTFCHFRDSQSTDITGVEELEMSDAMAWFAGDENVHQGDSVTVGGDTYRIVRTIDARRLGDTTVQFVKCYLQRLEAWVS